MRSRTPPISLEFQGGGTPQIPPRYATALFYNVLDILFFFLYYILLHVTTPNLSHKIKCIEYLALTLQSRLGLEMLPLI